MSWFDRIRTACEYVSDRARWVQIDHVRLMEYPEILLSDATDFRLEHTEEHHYLGKRDGTLAYFLILDAINFGSGYFPYLDKNSGVSGYFTVAERLKRHCETNGIPDPDFLAGITPIQCAEIFRQPLDSKHTKELMQMFAMALNALGEWVIQANDGDYLGFLKTSKSANEAINRLLEMSPYRDAAIYFGKKVPFLKRAQITIQDMKLAVPDSPLLDFPDIDELTVFADNVLPYVFRLENITSYDPWLEKRIGSEELIASGSAEEIELRATAVYLGERLAEIIREDFRQISVRELDYRLWLRGQKLKKTSQLKRHRCRCYYY